MRHSTPGRPLPSAIAVAALVASAASCILRTDVIPQAYNGGALDSDRDPFENVDARRDEIVARLVSQELADGYYGQGARSAGQHSVAAWLESAAKNPQPFIELVHCYTSGFNAVACASPTCAGDGTSAAPGAPAKTEQGARRAVADERLPLFTRCWTGGGPRDPICRPERQGGGPPGPGEADRRDPAAFERIVDEVRFSQAVGRAARAVADVLTERLVDESAVRAGAEAAFHRTAQYIERRRWRRERGRPTTGVVVKGGAATGIFSAGAVWTVLNLIDRCMSDPSHELCDAGRDYGFELVSGTSTGAMVATAVERFNAATSPKQRRDEIDRLARWFTCLSINDLFCAQSEPITSLFDPSGNPVRGVLRFDGIERLLSSCVTDDLIGKNRSELVLSTVEFRSGRLFSLSDQGELFRPTLLESRACVVQAALASALLPLIGDPVTRLPARADRPYDDQSPDATEPAYLDGGIRSEIPVLPLARRGAERVLVVSSAASILSETKRLRTGISLAARYIDVSTGGVTESELAHANRHVESIRLAEVEACRRLLLANRRELCPDRIGDGSACDYDVCLGTAASWAGACSRKPGRPGTPAPEPAPPEPTSQRVAPFWRVTGVFRDEREVDALNGYDFDPPALRRLFRAGAETARQRCLDVAVLLGIVPEGRIAPATRQRLFAWCGSQADAKEGIRSFLEKRAPEWKLSAARDKPDLLKEVL